MYIFRVLSHPVYTDIISINVNTFYWKFCQIDMTFWDGDLKPCTRQFPDQLLLFFGEMDRQIDQYGDI